MIRKQHIRTLILMVVLLMVMTLIPASSVTAFPITIERMEGENGQSNGAGFGGDISADGRYVVFVNNGENMVNDITLIGNTQIYLKDRQTGDLELITVDTAGTSGGNPSSDLMNDEVEITPDGRYVVFHSAANNLVEGDTNGKEDVFVYDRQDDTLELITASANNGSFSSDISDDGRYVVFYSSASNLVAGDTNGREDIFVYDRQNEMFKMLTQGNGDSLLPSISGNGRYVGFQSNADNLIAGDNNGTSDVFRYDLENDDLIMLSQTPDGTVANGSSEAIDLSYDGSAAVFHSTATDIVTGDTNGHYDIFLYDFTADTFTRPFGNTNEDSLWPHISPNGNYIIMQSSATNIIPGTSGIQVFFYDRTQDAVDIVSSTPGGTFGNMTSDTFLCAAVTDTGMVVFSSGASNLIPGDTNYSSDVFVAMIPIPPNITSDPPRDATINIAYTHDFAAAGNTPITYSVTAGALPDGLSINGDQITGTPTLAGDFSGTITATNSAGTDTQDFDITIGSPPSITSASPPDGVVGTAYSHTLTANGDAPITYSVTSGALPDGLSLNDGVISGTPTIDGTFTGEITATNDFGTDTQAFEIDIATAPTITSDPAPDGVVGTAYSHTFTADGDTPITFDVSSGALPDGLTLAEDTIIGTPTTPGQFTGEITATNAAGTGVQAFSITINPDNIAPLANNDAFLVTLGQPVDIDAPGVLQNDFDADDDPLTAIIDTDVTKGTLTLNSDGSFSYTPNLDATGTDSFTYFANDGTVNSTAPAEVILNLTDPAGTPPRLYPFNQEIVTGGSYQGPNFVFRHDGETEWYQIWVGTADYSTQSLFEWYPATNDAPFANGQGICDPVTNICTIPDDIWVNNGDFSWWMTTWSDGDTNADVNAAWDETKFSFAFDAPTSALTLTDPANGSTINAIPTTFTWNHDPDVLWYQVWIGTDDYATQIVFGWYEAAEICSEGVCTLDVPDGTTFPDGGYELWAEQWGPGGYATWPMTPNSTFTIDSASAAPDPRSTR